MPTNPIYVIGNTQKFLLSAKKDGVPWDLSGATVTLTLVRPAGTTLVKTATIVNGPVGVFQYTTLTTDFDAAGTWLRVWRVVDGSVDMRFSPIEFTVLAQNTAS